MLPVELGVMDNMNLYYYALLCVNFSCRNAIYIVENSINIFLNLKTGDSERAVEAVKEGGKIVTILPPGTPPAIPLLHCSIIFLSTSKLVINS
jgi:hypothetical protein